MGDLFHDDVPEDFINKVFTVMLATKEHTYILLTKRPQRAYKYLTNPKTPHLIVESLDVDLMDRIAERYEEHQPFGEFPLNNVWLGVAAENQQRADERIPVLLQTPASVHFISVEPMLGPINVFPYLEPKNIRKQHKDGSISLKLRPSVKWVIAGGETGPNARPVHPDWVRSLRNQCQTAGVPFFFKQWGEYIPPYDAGYRSKETDSYGKTFGYRWVHSSVEVDGLHMVKVGRKAAGRLLDGQEWNEMPEGVTPCPKATVRNTNII
jgi:protein gp37